MQKKVLPFPSRQLSRGAQVAYQGSVNGPAIFGSQDTIVSVRLPDLLADWLNDCEIRQHSPRTVQKRRIYLGRLLWFLGEFGHEYCDARALRAFFAHLNSGHTYEGGRWNKEGMGLQGDRSVYHKPLRPCTVATYHRDINAFFNWLVGEEYLTVNPMARIAPPVVRDDQIQPFTESELESLLRAARRSRQPLRNEATLRFLLGTGLRASEFCSLTFRAVDLQQRRVEVLGKGNKRRTVLFGRTTMRAVWNYLRHEALHNTGPDDPLFSSVSGQTTGRPMTKNGLLQLFWRLGEAAGIQRRRCSPHTMRHTFAIEFLRGGGDVFTLKMILGHTSLTQTNKYVAIAEADVDRQMRQFAPDDRLELRGGER